MAASLVILTKIGLLAIPTYSRNFVNVDEIRNVINDTYSTFSPAFARKLLHYIVRIVKDAIVISGHLEGVESLHDMIDQFEEDTRMKFTEKQVAQLEAEARKQLEDASVVGEA